MNDDTPVKARDLKRFVQQSARRKKATEEEAKRHMRNSSIDIASEKKEELEKVLNRRRRDYSRLIGFLAVATLILGCGFGAVRTWQACRHANRPAWARPEFSPEDLLAAENHALQTILKAERSRLTDADFEPDTPPYWREKAQRLLKELAQAKGTVGEVYVDDRHLGDAPRFIVDCQGEAGRVQILLEKTADGLRLVNVNKSW